MNFSFGFIGSPDPLGPAPIMGGAFGNLGKHTGDSARCLEIGGSEIGLPAEEALDSPNLTQEEESTALFFLVETGDSNSLASLPLRPAGDASREGFDLIGP